MCILTSAICYWRNKKIAEGGTTKSIAEKLHLSPKTVETHRTQLMDRLNSYDIAGLVRFAI